MHKTPDTDSILRRSGLIQQFRGADIDTQIACCKGCLLTPPALAHAAVKALIETEATILEIDCLEHFDVWRLYRRYCPTRCSTHCHLLPSICRKPLYTIHMSHADFLAHNRLEPPLVYLWKRGLTELAGVDRRDAITQHDDMTKVIRQPVMHLPSDQLQTQLTGPTMRGLPEPSIVCDRCSAVFHLEVFVCTSEYGSLHASDPEDWFHGQRLS